MISTRLVELVIDTVVCLTLAKWETVSGQFGGYLTDTVSCSPQPRTLLRPRRATFCNVPNATGMALSMYPLTETGRWRPVRIRTEPPISSPGANVERSSKPGVPAASNKRRSSSYWVGDDAFGITARARRQCGVAPHQAKR